MNEELLPEEEKKSKNKRYVKTDEIGEGTFSENFPEWEEEEHKVVITKADIKEVTRRINSMRIIKLLFKTREPLIIKDIGESLGISRYTSRYNLQRLASIGIIERVGTFDRKRKYFQLADYSLAKKLIRHYHYIVSFKFGDLVPHRQTVYIKDLEKSKEFIGLCRKYGLTVKEAIECMRMNSRKLETITHSTFNYKKKIVAFKRR